MVAAIFVTSSVHAVEPCRVEIVETGSGWPVPLVILETTGHLKFVTDNAGVVAIDEPELFGREVFLHVRSPGYEAKADGFGIRGVRITPKPGETVRVEVTRTMLAKRLGRLTGAGLFAESAKCEGSTPAGPNDERTGDARSSDEPPARREHGSTSRGALPAETGVVGCDSIQLATHRGKRFWMWGDTSLHHYPLGVFDMTCATTPIRALKSFEPPVRLSLDYFRDVKNGRPRGVARMPGKGPTWLDGFVSLPDAEGEPRLVASYAKIEPPLSVYERGLCVWNDETNGFERYRVQWTRSEESPKPPPMPFGHPVQWTDADGREWVLFGDPFPKLRCPATYEAWADASTWETIDAQRAVTSVDGEKVTPHRGSIAWHPWRKRWVTIFTQTFGKPSALGELWYAEAEAPTGPWGPAVKVLSHANYTFYNPRIHEEWFAADSPALCFEGTYTKTFADRPEPTPRWDYNQVLYRLDLDEIPRHLAQREARE